MSETTVTISIGRNIRDTTMGDAFWDAFRDGVRTLLVDVLKATVHVDAARSVGQWGGVDEESATFVAALPEDGGLEVLRFGLANLRDWYEQDAIALTVGTTEMV